MIAASVCLRGDFAAGRGVRPGQAREGRGSPRRRRSKANRGRDGCRRFGRTQRCGVRINIGWFLFDPQAVRSAAAGQRFSEVGGAAALSVFRRSYDVGTVTAGLRGARLAGPQSADAMPTLSELITSGLRMAYRGGSAYDHPLHPALSQRGSRLNGVAPALQ